MERDSGLSPELEGVLDRARTVGFLGPGPLRAQVDHAGSFTAALPAAADRLVDLGSGGGLPALPMLIQRPSLHGVLVEAMEKRAVFLSWAVAELGMEGRVTVRRARAEDAAHDPALRGWADAVTARGFGPPGRTAECAAGFLRLGGVLIVSEPPEPTDRWPEAGLAPLGFGPAERLGAVVRIPLVRPTPATIPRPTRALLKRPAF
jgi:16S rRNA (guanine527-N7)-methyltransferase